MTYWRIIILWFAVTAVLQVGTVHADDGLAARNQSQQEWPEVSLHPENPRYLLFRGKPLVLVTTTEHYGSVLNRPFDYVAYLDDLADKKMTLTRTFLLFRELQTANNPYSTCKPESADYIAPWPRSGTGRALDNESKYDLDRWNPEFFDRLKHFLTEASKRGIVVELTLFSCTYANNIWALNPLRAENNLQGVGQCELQDYISLKDPRLVAKQLEFTRKVVQQTCQFDNVYYETCNEAIGGFRDRATQEEVDLWQAKIAETIRDELRKHDRKHLVFGYHAASTLPEINLDKSFDEPLFDGVNFHPAINGPVSFRGKQYMLGRFFSNDIALAPLRQFCHAVRAVPKPCVNDEDNAAKAADRTGNGWLATRKRAWATVMSGCHYDVIDFSITIHTPTGSPEANRTLRRWIGHLAKFIHDFDFIHASPLPDWIHGLPDAAIHCTLGVPGKDYAAYLADVREHNQDPQAGQPIEGTIHFDLPDGQYLMSFFSPESGQSSPSKEIRGGQTVNVTLPEFRHDLVIRVKRKP